jgi:hypothetical protein
MAKILLHIIFITTIISCRQNMNEIEKNSVRITYKDFEPNEHILESGGIELLDKCDIEIYSDKTFYSVFAAYYKRDNSELPNVVSLIDYQFFSHNAFNQSKVKLFDTTFVYDKIELLLRVDKKANVLLNNDSLYFAIFNDFHVAPITMEIYRSGNLNNKVVNNFSDTEVIPLTFNSFWDKNSSRNACENFMIIGMVISDHPGKIDFKKMFDSENVKFHLGTFIYDNHFREKNPDLISRTDSFKISK